MARRLRRPPVGGGLIGILVLIAGVALLFTGRLPARPLRFVMGLNRWVLRVGAYATLMRDEYPPFRLDLGGRRPGHAAAAAAAMADAPAPPKHAPPPATDAPPPDDAPPGGGASGS